MVVILGRFARTLCIAQPRQSFHPKTLAPFRHPSRPGLERFGNLLIRPPLASQQDDPGTLYESLFTFTPPAPILQNFGLFFGKADHRSGLAHAQVCSSTPTIASRYWVMFFETHNEK